MTTEKQPDEGFANQKKDIVQRFREQYDPALADARVSAEHTATEGFQKLVSDHRDAMKARRRMIAEALHKIATMIEDYGADHDTEKEIQDNKKLVVELSDEVEAFERQVLQPVQKPAEETERIITNCLNEAERDERAAPLHNAGLVALLKMEIVKVARASFDRAEARLIIREPK